jgi:alpha-N-arabinofuranosidase
MFQSRTMKCALALGLALAAASSVLAQERIAVTVDAGKSGPRINRDIFGQFAEHLGTGIYGGVWVGRDSPIPNVRGIRSDVVAALRAIKVPNVRWPGGCFADEYHWREGVGPADKRPARVNASWGGVIEPNSFGTDEFMDFARQVDTEVFISVNVGSGTVQEAADWLEYLTTDKPTTLAQERAANGHPAPYKIKYLGLGNENWGCGGAMSAENYVEEMKRFAHYSRNLNPAQTGDNAMKRVAVGYDGGDSDYTEEVMKAWKEKVWSWDLEGVSLHSYTIPSGWPPSDVATGFGEADYARMIAKTLDMERLVTRQSAIMDKYDPDKKVGLYVDEWGAWLAPTPGSNPGFLQQQNSLRDAMVAALNLNIFMRHADRVQGTNIAQMINVLQAMILTDGPRMVLTPTYHVYHMYVPFQDATLVPATFNAGTYRHGAVTTPRVDAVAARDKSGRLWLAVTNVDPNNAAQVAVSIPGMRLRSASGRMLTAPKVDSINDFSNASLVSPKAFEANARDGRLVLSVPAKSITVVALDASR